VALGCCNGVVVARPFQSGGQGIGFPVVDTCLFLVGLGFGCLNFLPTASAHDSIGTTASLHHHDPEPAQTNERRARSKLAASALGIVFSTVGIVAGGVLVTTPDCRWAGDWCEPVQGAQEKRTAGKVLLVISPLTLGASIFGLVRSNRTLRKAHPRTVEPREPASWR